MRSLLDVNVLIALLDAAHTQHVRAHDWLHKSIKEGWASCPLTQNGVVRIMSQPRYPQSTSPSRVAALVGADGVGRPWADEQNGVYYYDNLVVLKYTRLPAVLLEAGVIVNRDEERELASPTRRSLTADAVAAGLAACGVTSGDGSAKMRSN